MIYCNNCKRFSEEPGRSSMEAETGYVSLSCPVCGHEDFEDARTCVCGEPTIGQYCEYCYDTVSTTMKKLKEELKFEQDDFEQIIANHFGW